ncbi:MAG TPA: HAMP domain-containing sensor histidine kinase [Oscillatoriaceae cyanobacterium]
MRKHPSAAPPIIYGIALILVTVVLVIFWNIALVTDWFRGLTTNGAGTWIFLASGYLLFLAVIVGLILFIISLARQIRMNQRQQNFIDAVTHELKSPLTSLKLHLETMRMRELPPEMRERFTSLMLADVERLNGLIDHVLEAARVDHKRREAAFEEIELVPLLEAAIAVARTRHNLPPEAIRLEAEPRTIKTDRIGLELVLFNLLDNAIKYSRDTVDVTVSLQSAPDGDVRIAVRDSGVGIPRQQLKRVFQRFYRIGNEMTRTRRGTGLGLFIVKETLRRLKGTIRADSPGENLGSTFTLTLPGGTLG